MFILFQLLLVRFPTGILKECRWHLFHWQKFWSEKKRITEIKMQQNKLERTFFGRNFCQNCERIPVRNLKKMFFQLKIIG